MDRTVLYVQPGAEAAELVKSKLVNEDVEFLVATTAKDALEIMNEREIMVVLTDCFIPDMKLLDFIKASVKSFPEVMLNVCVDVPDVQMVTNITNIRQVKKLYVEPWDVDEMAEGILATLDQMCIDNDFMKRQQVLIEERNQFETALNSLKEALLKQRYSYHKLEKALRPYLDAMIKLSQQESAYDKDSIANASSDAEKMQKDEIFRGLVVHSCEKMLRIMTTTKLEVDGLSEYIKSNMQGAVPKSGRIKVGNVSSSLVGNADRDKVALVVFCMWFLTLYQGYRLRTGTVEVDSYYMCDSMYRFEYSASGDENTSCAEEIHKYAMNLLTANCSEFSYDVEDKTVVYHLDFQIK